MFIICLSALQLARYCIRVSPEMRSVRYLWLLLCYSQYISSDLVEDYKELTKIMLYPQEDKSSLSLPIEIGKDKFSGCICRAAKNRKTIVCFGNYECKRFPKLQTNIEYLIVRTTVIQEIQAGALDMYYYLRTLRIEANHQLNNLQAGVFNNLTYLQKLSISYNSNLLSVSDRIFEGLINLRELILVNNGFSNIMTITAALKPNILPVLNQLDLSENALENIPIDAFEYMKGSSLEKLNLNLCRLDYIHPKAFSSLKRLKKINIGQNDLNTSLIIDFLFNLNRESINLTSIDLSDLGFRKYPPRKLMEIIANTTIQTLILADNQFEILPNDVFPKMTNIQIIDLRRVSAISIGPNVFEPAKFPSLRILKLGGNNLPGIHTKSLSDEQIVILDLSYNKGSPTTPMYYDIDKGAFFRSRELKVLNLAYNRIKSVFDYTFSGLVNLRVLNLENATLYFIGPRTFNSLEHLEILNLANNPLSVNKNLTRCMFQGLNELKVFILRNCGIKHLYHEDNIFDMTPNLTHLMLSNNQLYYISSETFNPLKLLKVLDLRENLLISWWKPLFMENGLRPVKLYLNNNKISQFTVGMLQDLNYLLDIKINFTVDIDLMDNVFMCDCVSMYTTFLWLQANGSVLLNQYFVNSKFLCSSPVAWEGRRVADFLSSVKRLQCLIYERITSVMFLMWIGPTIVLLIVISSGLVALYKYRIYFRYCIFLTGLSLGKFSNIQSSQKQEVLQGIRYKYDAFVSYCNEDKQFVAEMISQLESNPPYLKLCVYERDFEIGAFISESVLASINASRYIILIISRSFAKSQWCRWETQLAEYHRLFVEDGPVYDPLILVMIDQVDNKHLSTTLKFLLRTKIYLSWNDVQPDEFWTKLRNVLIKNT